MIIITHQLIIVMGMKQMKQIATQLLNSWIYNSAGIQCCSLASGAVPHPSENNFFSDLEGILARSKKTAQARATLLTVGTKMFAGVPSLHARCLPQSFYVYCL